MSEAPWVSHRDWTPEKVERQIAASFPELAGLEARYLDEGWDFQVFVAGEWAFKFPKRDRFSRLLAADKKLLDAVAPGCPIPVPQVELLAELESGDLIGGYRFLPGLPGIEAVTGFTLAEGSAKLLAAFLTHVHGIDAEAALGRPTPEEEPGSEVEWLAEVGRAVAAVESHLTPELAAKCRELVADGSLKPFGYAGPDRLRHRDLCADHVLIDPKSCQITGVIDWTDADAGDPAGDFAGIYAWQGQAFAEEVLRQYGLPHDPGLLTRARAHGFYWIVATLEYGLLADRPGQWRTCAHCLRTFFAG
jgi:aminoglycoside 2''-phosphotransferase